MSNNRFPWRVSAMVMNACVVAWFVVVIAANLPAVRSVVLPPSLDPELANIVAALLAAILLLSSLVIWTGALHHFQNNATLSGKRRSAWAVVVWGFFVFGGIAYYLNHMWRVRAAAA